MQSGRPQRLGDRRSRAHALGTRRFGWLCGGRLWCQPGLDEARRLHDPGMRPATQPEHQPMDEEGNTDSIEQPSIHHRPLRHKANQSLHGSGGKEGKSATGVLSNFNRDSS